MAEPVKQEEPKKDVVILATATNEAEAQQTIRNLRKIKPDLQVNRAVVCYDMDGKCVCDLVNSGLLPNRVATLFQEGKIRMLQGKGGPPVDTKLYELLKQTFIERGKAKQTP